MQIDGPRSKYIKIKREVEQMSSEIDGEIARSIYVYYEHLWPRLREKDDMRGTRVYCMKRVTI